MLYVRFPLSLRNVENLLYERGYDLCHETVRLWWNRFGPMFASEIRRRRVSHMRGFRHWRWHLDEMYVKLNGGCCQIYGADPKDWFLTLRNCPQKRQESLSFRNVHRSSDDQTEHACTWKICRATQKDDCPIDLTAPPRPALTQ